MSHMLAFCHGATHLLCRSHTHTHTFARACTHTHICTRIQTCSLTSVCTCMQRNGAAGGACDGVGATGLRTRPYTCQYAMSICHVDTHVYTHRIGRDLGRLVLCAMELEHWIVKTDKNKALGKCTHLLSRYRVMSIHLSTRMSIHISAHMSTRMSTQVSMHIV